MTGDIKIEEIDKEIKRLFRQYKYPWCTMNLPMDELQGWGIEIARKLKIKKHFMPKVTEIFWSFANVQLALGYALIARQTCKFPRGIKGTAFNEDDIPNFGLSEIHFWYHLYSAVECIYRCWERYAILLTTACYPDYSEKLYFDGIIKMLQSDPRFNKNKKLKFLESQVKHWNRAAANRNRLSHERSSPMDALEVEGNLSAIRGPLGEYIAKVDYSYKNIVQELDKIKNSYIKLLPAFRAVKEFIENIN